MSWSLNKPTVEGDYWYRPIKAKSNEPPVGVEVFVCHDNHPNELWASPVYSPGPPIPLHKVPNGQWYGPLTNEHIAKITGEIIN